MKEPQTPIYRYCLHPNCDDVSLLLPKSDSKIKLDV